MTIRLQEMHPALAHVPIALLPLTVGADLLGSATGNKSLLSFGKKAIVVAAAGAITSAASGQEVNVEGKSREMLLTHRNLNFAATVIASCMTLWRVRRQKPNVAYLGIGIAGVGIVEYTGYLGGKLVSEFGARMVPAKGVFRVDAPALGNGSVGVFLKAAGEDIVHGAGHMIKEVGKSQIVPSILAGFRKRRDDIPQLGSSGAPVNGSDDGSGRC